MWDFCRNNLFSPISEKMIDAGPGVCLSLRVALDEIFDVSLLKTSSIVLYHALRKVISPLLVVGDKGNESYFRCEVNQGIPLSIIVFIERI
ncbi:hypothetical protein CEXT_634601 [Caerostris extrusa]|uniref:Uncharacterized protein n=1 Tax=Caerostris extrusa TaxID=172846 RepID=A0AAV4U6R9_CAEEX|nr:hypothetical protein CEXT_634601 [Caerostris extrusa]